MNIISNKIDIKENSLVKLDYEIMNMLLKDCTSQDNIIWATNNYQAKGKGYKFDDHITVDKITGVNGNIIKPRICKTKEEQDVRIKEKAEVFTPSWICNKQNNQIDNKWFGEENIFNYEVENRWEINENKIIFPTKTGKAFEEYIDSTRLEITCGEAPYITSRYDTVTGEYIDVMNRIGLLDRKLRVINENVDKESDWQIWVEIAYKNIYAYEYQGDNLVIARENLLFTYIDNYYLKFNKIPDKELIKRIVEIIIWNVWQMDGIKFVIPNSCKEEHRVLLNFFGNIEEDIICLGCKKNNYKKHNGIYCKIMNWKTKRKIKFVTFLDRGKINE